MRAQIARVSLRRPPTCDAAHTHTHKRERANPPPLTLTPKHPHPSCGRPAYFVSGGCASMSLCKPRTRLITNGFMWWQVLIGGAYD